MRAAMAGAAVLGGLCWMAAGILAGWVDPLSAIGAVLLAAAVVGAGASLANRSATWLRLVAGVCSLGLVASIVLMLRDTADDGTVLAVAGAAAAVAGVVVLSRRPTGTPRSGGAHAGSHAR
jgi:hypothetical protein